MKTLIFGLFLGFVLHGGFSTIHDVLWWKYAKICRFETKTFGDGNVCVESKLGIYHYIGVLGGHLTKPWNENWEWTY